MRNPFRYFIPTLLTTAVVVSGFFWLREEVTTRIYRNKLEALTEEYAALVDRYNHAVRQSAITELEVTEDSITVLIRTLDGSVRRIPTPYDPGREIFVDYLVGNGRIWIRRVFDQRTAPENGLVIDPVWETVDWASRDLSFGKIVYRSLQPGIWSIQVSGNGALTLEPVERSRSDLLDAAPEIRSFEEMRVAIEQEAAEVSLRDIWEFCISIFRTEEKSK